MQDALLPIPDIVGFQGSAALAAREKAGLEALKREFLRDDPAPRGIEVRRPYAESVWVHDCVSRRAAAVASVPLQLKRNDNVIENHPVLDLLGRGTNCGNLTQFLLCTEAFHALDGEVFWLAAGARGLRGEPERLFVVSGRQMRHDTVGDDEGFEVLLGWIFTGGFHGRRIPFLPEEVGQLARFNPYNNFRGLSALVAAGLAVQQDVGAKKWNLSILVNDAEPGGILTADGTPDEAVIDSIREQWRSRHEGIDNKRKIAILYGGLKWQQISATAKEIAWVEGQQISREEICAALDVPPAVAGIFQDANRSNADMQAEQFWGSTIVSRLEQIADTLNTWLLPKYRNTGGMAFVFDTTQIAVLQKAKLNQIDRLEKLVQLGTPLNDAIALLKLDLSPTEWGKHFWVTQTQQPAQWTLDGGPEALFGPQLPEGESGDDDDDDEKCLIPKDAATASAECLTDKDEESRRTRLWRNWIRTTVGPERKARGLIRSVFVAQARQMVKRLRANWPQGKAVRVPPASAVTKDAIVESILIDFDTANRQLRAKLMPHIEETAELGVRQGLDETRDRVDGDEVEIAMNGSDMRRFIARKRIRIAGINATTIRHVRRALETGLREGVTINTMAQRIGRITGVSGPRAITIARTETLQALNFGRATGFRAAGVTTKAWLTARDDAVRPEHTQTERDTFARPIPIDQAFLVGGFALMQPGDPAGPPQHVINCRCTLIAKRLRVNRAFYDVDRMRAEKAGNGGK